MDLSTTYMGLQLKNPVVLSASPLSKELDTIMKLEDAGAAGVVLYSVFEEQIEADADALDHYLTRGAESYQEAISYFPQIGEYRRGPDEYVAHVAKAKEAVDIPIIGSLNGVATGGWVDYAKKIQEAGADALELNVYFVATDPNLSSAVVEDLHVDILKAVKAAVTIPVAVKIGPFFSSMSNMAKKLDDAGADALVLFNRFYQPDIDLANLEVKPDLKLSTSDELRLPLRWIAILAGNVQCSLAATTGVHTAEDVLKLTMAGADVTMMCSAVLHHGIARVTEVIDGVTKFLEAKDYASLAQARGSLSQQSCAEPAAFERANYMKALNSYSLSIPA
ncbi:MAG: dihydroorotate dehydrogenase [Armatimonadetes bacterium CG_4_10_14_3_um_filter_66_18]|nr:dihydroorotate dehydrogenase-like protein [Armatimonadota bacterium]OIO91690.1 MAG: dihydroorotate dehydrogenase [Armatimonadetes bacterium CG2_30_66_41]PIU92987.1 MAG: dihydroorotate dehydrogenase [Armatimonadetes bacterium CG06_land_8_20_14_3_00_66_21]PIX50214.1 MAG: dihydroorotate dehydrogenase [Armatimonadetes bacterium CG_4_8_14_3_um_filter_66_20]PIY50242.1 MAG: dihydroorotate dehydrogenase [Armatimonadetes bacterium CG_4_10_14_3_um_filter_66_18]PJB64506.1 MAG: dihydroorotate dehydroge